MSSLQYYNPPGIGTVNSDENHCSQAVVIGNIVKCAAQGGWDDNGYINKKNVQDQVDRAFENVDKVLQTVGLRGWEDVYLLRSYHVDIGESHGRVARKLRERIPNHRPVWTAVTVDQERVHTGRIELEVEAYIPPPAYTPEKK